MRAIAIASCALSLGACSLPREVLGATDGGTRSSDAFVARSDTGVDAARATSDAGLDVGMAEPDVGTPLVDAGSDAAVLVDAGGCRGDLDCPATMTTSGACTFASECASSGTMMQTTTSYTCVDHVCIMHTSPPMAVTCSRTTDGVACGGGTPTCGACSTTACGDTGTMTCTSMMCAGGACVASATSTSCTTPDDMCGSLSDWGFCTPDTFGASTCHQTRAWGQCEPIVGCLAGAGQSESRPCTCPHFPGG